MSSIPTFSVGLFQFPDTPEGRRVAEMHESQVHRRAAVHMAISYPPTILPTVFVSPERDAASRRLFFSPLNGVPSSSGAAAFQANFVEPDCLTAAATEFSALAIQSMLSGSSQITQHSSSTAFNNLMSAAIVPAQVADQKKNKAATAQSFIAQIKKLDPQIILPTEEVEHDLRTVITDAINEIGSEYKTAAHPVFTSQMIVTLLAQSKISQKIHTQVHRYLMCDSDPERQIFGDYCALGKAAPSQIDFSILTSQLPGFRFLAENPYEWIQFATFLLDYACFVSHSGIQRLYQTSKLLLAQLSVAEFDSVQEYADAEEQHASSHHSAANAARRSQLDSVDRGNLMLSSLSNDLKVKINKRARKTQIPESCQTHDWVVSELTRLELHDDPVFSWFKLEHNKAGLCKFFLQGNCRRNNCRFSHDHLKTADNPAPPNAQPDANSSMATMSGARPAEDLSAPGVVDIQCKAMLAPSCEANFKANPAYWSAIIGPDGTPFTTPKSCSTCRRFKKAASMITEDNFSMVAAADELNLADDGQHDNDGAADDYFAYDHDSCMSDAK